MGEAARSPGGANEFRQMIYGLERENEAKGE